MIELLVNGRGFAQGTLASSINKTDRHDIAEILLKVGLNTENQSINQQKVCIAYPNIVFDDKTQQ